MKPGDLEFEYDPAKAESNLKTHGIEMDEAQDLWLAEAKPIEATVIVESTYRAIGRPPQTELRVLRFGFSKTGKFMLAVYTMRGKKIRLISVRRANAREKANYDKKTTS